MINEILSICIPTYNRAKVLRETLQDLISKVAQYSIPIYISDNASPDNTEEIVKEMKQVYPYVFYSRNKENLGPDANFVKVLQMSKSRYSWLLSDDDLIKTGAIAKVLQIAKQGSYDLIVVNAGEVVGRVKDLPTTIYKDPKKLLADLGWHMTYMSCLIYSSAFLKATKFEEYICEDKDFNFLQTVVIFENFASKEDISVYWENESLIYGSGLVSSSLQSHQTMKVFDIFGEKWLNAILSLPSFYPDEIKYKCIKDHGIKSGIFSFKGILLLRMKGYYSYYIFKKYKSYFKYLTNIPKPILLLISIFPKKVILLMSLLYKRIIKLKIKGGQNVS